MANMEKTTKKANPFYLTKEWRKKRQEILDRDNHECQECKRQGKVTTRHDMVLEVDHIKELNEYPELAMDNDNLQTLCKKHHNIKHGRYYKFRNKPKKPRSPLINDEWFGE